MTQVVHSIGGTITRTYDGVDRLLSETTPEGSISYTYDADGRRATMTVHYPGFRVLAETFTEFLRMYRKDPMSIFQK